MVISGFLISCLLIGFIIVLLYIKQNSTIKSIREAEDIINHRPNRNSTSMSDYRELIDTQLNKIEVAHNRYMQDNNYSFLNDSNKIYTLLDSISNVYIPFQYCYLIKEELTSLVRDYGNYNFWEDKYGFKYFKRKSGSISKQIEKENIEKGILSIDVHSNKNRIIGLYFKDIDMSIKFDNDTKFIIINNITNYQFNHLFVKLLLNKVNFKYQ